MSKVASWLVVTAAIVLSDLTLEQSAAAAVGRTPGSFNVTPTGSASYSIPIWAAHAPGDMQPAVSLYYDSRAPIGTVGLGWSISGLGAITRCPRTIAQDAAAAPVALLASDGYCLNGNRLRLTSGTYGTAGSTYQTEVADFSQITAEGTAGNGPAYFSVQASNGLTFEYGFTDANGNGANSQVLVSGTALTWLLSKVIDRAGNNYVVNYTTLSGAVIGTAVPAEILWAPSALGSATYLYAMQFNYSANVPQSSTDKYVAGAHVANPELLSSIEILSSGAVVKDYFLGYQRSAVTNREQLTSVTECADSGQANCLSPTSITYGGGSPGVSTTVNTAFTGTVSHLTARYDLNGDGYPDLVYEAADFSAWYVSFGSASGYGGSVNIGINANVDFNVLIGRLAGLNQDSVLANNNGTWWNYSWNGTQFVGASTGIPYDTSSSIGGYELADINGDGLPDLVELTLPYNLLPGEGFATITTRLNTSSGGGVSFSSPVTTQLTSAGLAAFATLVTPDSQYGKLRRFDFNGDHQDDLVLVTIAGSSTVGYSLNTYELISTGSGFTSSLIHSQSGSTYVPVFFTDWNDDACTDFVTGNVLYVAGCNGTAAQTFPISGTVLGAMDWDGDGRTDLLVSNGATIGVYLSTGSGMSALNATSVPYSSSCDYVTMDAAGGGLDDLGCWTPAGSLTYYLHNGVPDLVTRFEDGYGNYASPSYVPLVQAVNSYYFLWSNAQYPYESYLGPMYIVNNVSYNDPSGSTAGYSQQHFYAGALVNVQGRGFSGFGAHQTYDSRNGFWETRDYSLMFPYTGMQVLDITTLNNTTSQTLYSSTAAAPQQVTLSSTSGQQRYFAYIPSTTALNYELGASSTAATRLVTTTTTSFTYDNYGNPLTVAQTTTDNDSNSPYFNDSWSTTTTFTPDVDASSNWCLRLFTQSEVAYSASNGSTAVTRTKQFTPDTTHCRYTQIVTEPSSSSYKVTEVLGYDSFGNISSESLVGANMTARQTSINWGTTGQFPVSATDASGAQTQFTYNANFGLLSGVTDPNALTTTWQYDAFGRTTKQTNPDGTATNWTYTPCAAENYCPGTSRMLIDATSVDTGGNYISDVQSYPDAVDRVIQVFSRNQNSATQGATYTFQSSGYDALGRLISSAIPSLTSVSSVPQTTYSYDVLNRVLTKQQPVSAANSALQETSFAYAGRTTTVTDANGHSKTLIRDVNGWLRETRDATGYAIILGYDAAGSANSTTDSLGNTLWSATYQYGVNPFMVSRLDTDLGNWSYGYDALGELTNWTDAKGQTFSMTYDALSRPLTRAEPDLFTQWTWGSSIAAREIGQLHSVCTGVGTNPTACTSSGYAESETYDSLGRPSQRSIQIPDDVTYTYNWAYAATTGLLSTLTYPATSTGYRLQLQFGYANGFLVSIGDISDSPNVTLWTANSIDGRGNYLQETLGNHIVVNHAFDAVNGWPSSITAGLPGATPVQNNSYLFDEVGNLTQRQDNIAGTTENVYPDVLNRLDHTVGDTNAQLSYDSADRLANWSAYQETVNINNYTTTQPECTYYSNPQMHALRQSTQGSNTMSYCYDANGNNVSVSYKGALADTNTWTSYNKPNLITGGWPSIAAGPVSTTQFFYDHNHERWQQVANNAGALETTLYVGGLLEKVRNSSGTSYRYYVPAGNNLAVYNRWSTGTNTINYITTDHLGSTAAITDPNGNLVVKEQFAALGWNENTSAQQATMAAVTRHEYTGAEVDGNLSLVNLNGRIFVNDGTMRFLSPDPYIPRPADTLSYNRYSYARYNPLTLIDPTGFDEECIDEFDMFDQDTYQFAAITFPPICFNYPDDIPTVTVTGSQNSPNPAPDITPSLQQFPTAPSLPEVTPKDLSEVVVTAHHPSPCDMLAEYQQEQAEAQNTIANALEKAGLSREAAEAALEQLAKLPPGSNVVAVGSAQSWVFLNGSAAAKYGFAYVDPVGNGGQLVTGMLTTGAKSALRFVPLVGYGISGGQVAYELAQGHYETAAYKTFDAAASAAAARYAKGPGILVALAFNLAGGSEGFVLNAPLTGLSLACATSQGQIQ